MLQETVTRLRGIDGAGAPLIVANESHRFMIAEQLRLINVKPGAIMLEPAGRNTAPAVAVAALHAAAKKKDPVLLVLPADHVIKDVASFHAAVAAGERFARQGRLITFGIVPAGPETGYGYIKKGKSLGAKGGPFSVERFVEKPDLATAKNYVSSGGYLWNSGMFMFSTSAFLKELRRFAPANTRRMHQGIQGLGTGPRFPEAREEAFVASPSDSIDYAVMEKTASAAVIPLMRAGGDVGSWHRSGVHPHDRHGNAVSGDVIAKDTKNSLIHAEAGSLPQSG